eukprot:gene34321-46038_t
MKLTINGQSVEVQAAADTPEDQAEKEAAVPPREFPVLFEDEHLLVIDKPAGVAVHGGSGVSFGVIEQLRRARPQARFLELVHRLDKETSGALLLAKKRSALTALQDQFRQRETGKTYAALVIGTWPASKKVVDVALHKYLNAEGCSVVLVARDAARLAAHQGQFDRGRHQRGAAQHHRQAHPGIAGGVIDARRPPNRHPSESWDLMRQGKTTVMPLYLNDEQAMLRDTAKGFVAEHAPVSHMRGLRDSNDATGFSRELWKQFAELGLTGILIGEDHGGLGLGHVEAGIVLEEIGRNLSPSPFLSTAVAAVAALSGTPHAARWFPGIVAGETVAALAIDEAAKHRVAIGLKAERSGNGFKLTGKKQFVTHGHVADLLIVAARTAGSPDDAEGITLFAVDKGAAGLTNVASRPSEALIASPLSLACSAAI